MNNTIFNYGKLQKEKEKIRIANKEFDFYRRLQKEKKKRGLIMAKRGGKNV